MFYSHVPFHIPTCTMAKKQNAVALRALFSIVRHLMIHVHHISNEKFPSDRPSQTENPLP